MENIVAERKLILELPTGERKPVTIKIGTPYQTSEDNWACPFGLDSLYKKPSDAAGVDSFQALMLAQNLVRTLLRAVIKDGCKLFVEWDEDTDGASEIDVDEMFLKGL